MLSCFYHFTQKLCLFLCLHPAPQPAATNTPSPATVIDDDQEEDVQMTFEDELVEGDDTADDDDCPNIFDIIDNLMIE